MPEIIGIDHIFITVSDLDRSEKFYDAVMEVIGFRKGRFQIGTEKHIQYYNRHFGIVLRPARDMSPHNPYAPGLHHLCLRVESEKDVHAACGQAQRTKHFRGRAKTLSGICPGLFCSILLRPRRNTSGNYQLPAGASATA